MSTDSDRTWQPPAQVAANLNKLATDKINRGLASLVAHGEALMRIPELTAGLVQPNGDIPLHPLLIAVAEYQQDRKKLPELVAVCNRFLPFVEKASARIGSASAVEAATAGGATQNEIDTIAIALNDVVRSAQYLAKYQLPVQPPAVDRTPAMEENGQRIWFGR